MLCILLPKFREMELPIVSIGVGTNGSSEWNVNERLCCRPAYQSSLWNLIRGCLGRCGDSNNFKGDSRGEGGDAGGRGSSLLSRGKGYDNDEELESFDSFTMDQLLRRRAAHILRLLVEYERECTLKAKGKQRGDKEGNIDDTWMKYVLVFEMLEMEIELHLVDQVWETMTELASQVTAKVNGGESGSEVLSRLPTLDWDDISSLLSRVLLSDMPTLRKLALYRFLNGQAGVEVKAPIQDISTKDGTDDTTQDTMYMKKPKSKYKIKKDTGSGASSESASLSVVSVKFVLEVVMRCFDTLLGTKVGTNMQLEDDGHLKSESVTPLLQSFISNYVVTLATMGEGNDRLSEFVRGVFSPLLIENCKTRSVVVFYRAVASALESVSSANGKSDAFVTLDPELVQSTIRSMTAVFSSGGAPRSLQEGLKQDFALALKHTLPWKNPDVSIVLQILGMYPPNETMPAIEGALQTRGESQSIARNALSCWLRGLGDGAFASNAASACTSAFVLGQLLPFGEVDINAGIDKSEREMAMAICTLCCLTGIAASELLWPAVFKGLQIQPAAVCASPGFSKAYRSMLLLEFGCREGAISGLGNGDIVMDKAQQMMPPPPNIEMVLCNAVNFVLEQVMAVSTKLIGTVSEEGNRASGANRSSTSNNVSSIVATLIGQLLVIHQSFPSSNSLSSAVNEMLQKTITSLVDTSSDDTADDVKNLTLLYAALSCGAEFSGDTEESIRTIQRIINMEFALPQGTKMKKEAKQAFRSVFQYAKW